MRPGPARCAGLRPSGLGWRRKVVRTSCGLAGLSLLGGCARAWEGGVFHPAGPIGDQAWTITVDALLIMMVVAIPTILLTFWMAWRYRASNTKAQYLPEWAFSGRIEAIVWAIPLLVIMLLGGVIWIGSNLLDPYAPLPSKNKPLEVQVVSLDWKWLFIYPDQGVASVNQLVVPVGVPVHFLITSGSVMNVFFVPQLGTMIYAMNGMTTQLHLQADRLGSFRGQSSQFSGDGFSDMNFQWKSVPAAQFAAWTSAARAGGPVLDRAAYDGLKQQSHNVRPYTYRAVQPDLFQAIATQKIPPGPGPTPEAPEHAGREVTPVHQEK
jgi:cytochrome o ubiquinol oxidase subunit II